MSQTLNGPAYRIHTARMIIRCWHPADATLLKTAIDTNLDHLRPWMPWAMQEPTPLPEKIKRLRRMRGEFDLDQDFIYGIFNMEETQVIGGTGLHTRIGDDAREIGYWIDKDHLNQGLATEASAALTKVAFEIEKVDRVEIHCDPQNVRSATVPKKLDFLHEGNLKRRITDSEGKYRDTMIWSLFAPDYPDSMSAKAQIQAFDAVGQRLI